MTRDVTGSGGNSVDRTTTAEQGYDYDEGLRKYVFEASVLSKFFNLPGIVSVKDFFYENSTAYIVMEYIDGVSLKDYLKGRGGVLPADETINLIRPVISSLSVVHNNKLLHRDISPDNIMIQKDGTVKLIDFGTARFFDSMSGEKSMTVMLKHGYAPIEQYSRSAQQGAYTDVYALCAVMYRMITGKPPEEATDRVRKDTLLPVRKAAPKTSRGIAAAIEKGLSVMPEDRQQSMAELEQDLFSSRDKAAGSRAGVYGVTIRLLSAVLVCLLVLTGVGLYKKFRRKRDVELERRLSQSVILEEEELEEPDEEDTDPNGKNSETETGTGLKTEDTGDEERDGALSSKEPESAAEEQIPPLSEPASLREEQLPSAAVTTPPEVDPGMKDLNSKKISYAVMIVRDGVIRGNESLTTGEILDRYSDIPGTWSGYVDPDTHKEYVYYTGEKNGEQFSVEFTVDINNDTFRVTAAEKNGVKVEDHSGFFQNILTTVGL